MKICFLLRTKDVYLKRWYEYFLDRGHEVHIVSGDESNVNIEVAIPTGVKVHYVPEKKLGNQKVSFGYNLLRLPLIIKELKKIIKKISPDIIHAHMITPCGLWAALCGFHPFVITPQGSDVIILARENLIYKLITRFVLKKADIITSDSFVLQDAIYECGGKQSKTHIIQNGVDLTVFKPGNYKNAIRERHGFGDAPLILSNRGITPLYNIDCIIKSIPSVLQTFPDAKFLFCYSYSSLVPDLKKLASSLGVSDSIIFNGFVKYEDMPFYQAAADINVSVPSSDSSPSSVYEAMACGTPVIISELPWTKYFMKNGENALMVPPQNPEAIANSIVEILKNNSLKNRLIKGGLSTVKKYVDYHRNMEMMEKLIEGHFRKD